MSLDASFHMVYGYKVNGHKLLDDILKYTSEEKKWILPNGIDYDTFEENMDNAKDLCFVNDYMCGDYCYLGIPLINYSDEYGESWSVSFTPKDLLEDCNDEELDRLIQEKIPFIVGNEYDVAGLLYGELPKLYIVKRVW